MTDSKHRQQAIEALSALISDIPAAMLTTFTPHHGLRSRPMVNVNTRFDGYLWFLAQRHDPKVMEVTSNPQVNVSFVSPSHHRYVSVSGSVSVVRDQKRVELLWTDTCGKWFPDGNDYAELVLLRVDVDYAEYWDQNKGVMQQISGLIKQALSGTAGGETSLEHEKIDWQQPVGKLGSE